MRELKKEEKIILVIFFHGGNGHNIQVKWEIAQDFFKMYRQFLKMKFAKTKEEIESLGEVWVNFVFNGVEGDVQSVIDFSSVASCGLLNIPEIKNECASTGNDMAKAFKEYIEMLKAELKRADDWKGGQ